MRSECCFRQYLITGTSTVDWSEFTWRTHAMIAENVVTIERSFEVGQVVTLAGSNDRGLKPSKFVGLVSCCLMPAGGLV
jgi:hypothetical protein